MGSVSVQDQIAEVTRILREKDPFKILGLSSDCSDKDVNNAFRNMALLVHPDKCKVPNGDEAFKRIKEAKQGVLLNLSRRVPLQSPPDLRPPPPPRATGPPCMRTARPTVPWAQRSISELKAEAARQGKSILGCVERADILQVQ